MQQDFLVQAKDYIPENSMKELFDGLLEPEVPGRVIADLALRAPAELSGKYVHWNDPVLAAL